MIRLTRTAMLAAIAIGLGVSGSRAAGGADDGGPPDAGLRELARAALRKSVEFYRTKVATEGGYHFAYAEDLSYGRSEHSEGPTRVEVQRDGTPLVGLAYLDAYDATGDAYYLDAARDVARALVRGQYCSGGWDYLIEFDPEKRAQFPYRADGRCGAVEPKGNDRPTTLDDNVTQSAVRVLMRVDRALQFKDAAVHEAARFALDSLVAAQYPNGAWPQRYSRFPDPGEFPVTRASYPESWPRTWPGPNYFDHYTFNDYSVIDVVDAMLEASRIYREPRYLAAAEKAGEFMLLAQMPDPQPGWAQQYDRRMHPAWARQFEPPSVTGGESQGVMQALILLARETGKAKYLDPLPRAVAYYRQSLLPDVDDPSEVRRRACPGRTPCAARFYELETNKPLYVTKGTRVTALDRGVTNVDGYELSYSDASVITHYSVLVSGAPFAEIAREHDALLKSGLASAKRPERLRGLSPWSDARPMVGTEPSSNPSRSHDLETQVRVVIEAMDARGAWMEEGSIGRSRRLVSVLAGRDLTVTLGGKTLPMKENDVLEVFSGSGPPPQRIIRSRTFAENVAVLIAYIDATKAAPRGTPRRPAR